MPIGHLLIDGRKLVVVDESEYSRLVTAAAGAAAVDESDLPPLLEPDSQGAVPALEFARVSLARKLIVERNARGWSQAQLARLAGVRIETINRLEKAKHTADPGTAKKIQKALDASQPSRRTIARSR